MLKRSNQFTITKDCEQPNSSIVFTVDAYITLFASRPAGIPPLYMRLTPGFINYIRFSFRTTVMTCKYASPFWETCICKKCAFGQTNASNSVSVS